MIDDRKSCLGCRYADGRAGSWPFALLCSRLSSREAAVSALWARRTPVGMRGGCGVDAAYYEDGEP